LTDKRTRSKLTWDDVRDIREWACTAGFGRSINAQAEAIRLMPCFADYGVSTLSDVLSNATWFDPHYDRTKKLTWNSQRSLSS
jgi:hypothetical protein